jgi:hypothetical protein
MSRKASRQNRLGIRRLFASNENSMSRSRGDLFCGTIFFAVMVCTASIALGQMPGSVKVTTSKLDGERQVQIQPGWLQGQKMTDKPPKLGGFWTDKSPTNFTLEVVLFGESKPENVRIGIDGRISDFPTTNGRHVITYTEGVKAVETGSRFVVPLSFVQQMVAGTNVIIQVEDARGFTEGVFSSDAPTQARPGFKKALEKIQDPESEKSTSPATAKSPRVK